MFHALGALRRQDKVFVLGAVMGLGPDCLGVAAMVKLSQSKTTDMLIGFAFVEELLVLWEVSVELNGLGVEHVLEVALGGQPTVKAPIEGKHEVHGVLLDIDLHELVHVQHLLCCVPAHLFERFGFEVVVGVDVPVVTKVVAERFQVLLVLSPAKHHCPHVSCVQLGPCPNFLEASGSVLHQTTLDMVQPV